MAVAVADVSAPRPGGRIDWWPRQVGRQTSELTRANESEHERTLRASEQLSARKFETCQSNPSGRGQID